MKPGLYETLERIAAVINERKGGDAASSYVARLLAESEDAVLKKIGEEATEVVLAAKGHQHVRDGLAEHVVLVLASRLDRRELLLADFLELVRETADLWFHCLILLARHGLGPADVLAELHRREGISGIDEKAARKRSKKEGSK